MASIFDTLFGKKKKAADPSVPADVFTPIQPAAPKPTAEATKIKSPAADAQAPMQLFQPPTQAPKYAGTTIRGLAPGEKAAAVTPTQEALRKSSMDVNPLVEQHVLARRDAKSLRGVMDDSVLKDGSIDEMVEDAKNKYLTLRYTASAGRGAVQQGFRQSGAEALDTVDLFASPLLGRGGTAFTPENQMKSIERFLEKYAPEELTDVQGMVVADEAVMARQIGAVGSEIVQSLLPAGIAIKAVRALPLVLRLRSAGQKGIYAANVIENVAASLAVNAQFSAKKGDSIDEYVKTVLANPSALLPFARKSELLLGFGADMLAGMMLGMSTEDAALNAAGGLGGNVMGRIGVQSELRGFEQAKAMARTEMDRLYAIAPQYTNDVKGMQKVWDESLKGLQQRHKMLMSDSGFDAEKGRKGIERPARPDGDAAVQESTDVFTPEKLKAPEGQRERGFFDTVKRDENTSPELRQKVQDKPEQFYDISPTEPMMKQVKKQISSDITATEKRVFSDEPVSQEKAGLAVGLAQHYEDQALKKGVTATEKNALLDKSAEVIEKFDEQLREAGRFIQVAALWKRSTPQGFLRFAERQIEKFNKTIDDAGLIEKGFNKIMKREKATLTPEDKRFMIEKMRESQTAKGDEKNALIREALERINEKIPPGANDFFDAYRYQNMLSSPRTQWRNIYGNAFQMLVTRPVDLAFTTGVDVAQSLLTGKQREYYIRDVPNHYKELFNSVPKAAGAAKEAWNGTANISKIDAAALRRFKNLPKSLTFVGRFMEATDRMGSTMLASAEYARLRDRGVEPGKAKELAATLAEQYLFRGSLKNPEADHSALAKSVAEIGNWLTNLRKSDNLIVRKTAQIFIPFITTPTRVAMEAIDHTPLGFIGGKQSKEQMGRAAAGTAAMGVGLMLATQGDTTWAAPTDEEGKKLFYASGRRPYSIRLPGTDTWVPMWTFGPFALALAIPAAHVHHTKDSPDALSDTAMEKVGKIMQESVGFIMEQSPLAGANNFFKVMSGDADYSTAGSIGFTGTQFIPFSGFLRFVSQNVDPIYRKTPGLLDQARATIPGMSFGLEAQTDPFGEPAARDPRNILTPWDWGFGNKEMESLYQDNRQMKQIQRAQRVILETAKDPNLSADQKQKRIDAIVEKLTGDESAGTGGDVFSPPTGSSAAPVKEYLPF